MRVMDHRVHVFNKTAVLLPVNTSVNARKLCRSSDISNHRLLIFFATSTDMVQSAPMNACVTQASATAPTPSDTLFVLTALTGLIALAR